MKKLEHFFGSAHFLLLVVIVLIFALFIHTTIVIYSFHKVENQGLRIGSALLFSIPLSLLVMVFTLHRSHGKSWEFDASGWLAIGTALIFILYMQPWRDGLENIQNAILKVLIGAMIGIGEYALPRLYAQVKERQQQAGRYRCACGYTAESEQEFYGHLARRHGGKSNANKNINGNIRHHQEIQRTGDG